ncbi:MAG: hypothetical protein HY706_18540 [Candidatus Hydrogenedentes bacterium]|nr:hypothetical protein [Candidatus Hydrogenedentota bacterium]
MSVIIGVVVIGGRGCVGMVRITLNGGGSIVMMIVQYRVFRRRSGDGTWAEMFRGRVV